MKKREYTFFGSKKVNVFLLFVLLALLFSILTKLSKDYTKTITFNIQPINVPEDKLILKDTLHELQIDLTTYGFKLLRYYFVTPSIKIDINELDNVNEEYIWTQRKAFSRIVSQFDTNVKIENINPDSLRFRFDTNAIKMVPVVLNSDISFSPGFNTVEKYQLVPDSIKIIGPQVILDTISQVTTSKVTLADINTDISQQAELNLPMHEQLRFSHKMIRFTGKVDRFTEGSINVPVVVTNVPDNIEINIYPKTIPVIYYASLSNFERITVDQFAVECDYNKAVTNDYLLSS